MPDQSQTPVLVLTAHPEPATGAGRLAQLAGQVAQHVPDLLVVGSDANGLPDTLATMAGRPVLVLPMLFSDGFIYEQKIKPAVTLDGHTLAPPLALWPRFPAFLADNVAARALATCADPQVVLVAHGSRTPGRSAACARAVARKLASAHGRVATAFLEEAPLASELVARIDEPYVLAGLFFGAGQHGDADFAALSDVALRRPEAAFTVGELPGLPALVAAEARARLPAA